MCNNYVNGLLDAEQCMGFYDSDARIWVPYKKDILRKVG